MMKLLCILLTMLLALQPMMASAQRGGGRGGGGRGGGGARASGGMRGGGGGGARAGGMSRGGGGRSGAGSRGGSAGGFNLGGDTMRGGSMGSYRGRNEVGSGNFGNTNRGNGIGDNNRNGIGDNNRGRNDIGSNNNRGRNDIGSGNRRTNINTGNRTVINNPVYGGAGAYGWNGGVAWAPAPYYYGGGFWGAMAIGVTSAAVFGAVVDEDEETHTETTYNSYEVQPNSPGSTLLSNYQLVQVKCGPEGLVVIYGPENSVICANPTDQVKAGTYELNTETLSLTSVQQS